MNPSQPKAKTEKAPKKPERPPKPKLKVAAYAYVLLSLLSGVASVWVARYYEHATHEPTGLQLFFFAAGEHLGAALLVAPVVALFFHVPEFSEFFTDLAKRVLVDHHFLRKLSLGGLRELNTSIAAVTVEHRVKNPKYDYRAVANAAHDLLYSSLLPNEKPQSGYYRTDYREFTTVKRMTLRDVYRNLKKDESTLVADADTPVLEQTIVTSYSVVAPSFDSRFEVAFGAELTALPFPEVMPHEQLRLWVGTSEATARQTQLDVDQDRGARKYQRKADDEHRFVQFEEGVARVWMKSIDYRLLHVEPFVLNTMSHPTRGAHISVHTDPALGNVPLGYQVFGFGGDPDVVIREPDRLELTYSSWFLKDHGWCVWW